MWEYEIGCRISTNKNSIVIAMLQKLLDHPYLTIGSIIAISVLTRMAFQYYRRRQRRCHCCGSTNIIRRHIVTRMVDFSDNSECFVCIARLHMNVRNRLANVQYLAFQRLLSLTSFSFLLMVSVSVGGSTESCFRLTLPLSLKQSSDDMLFTSHRPRFFLRAAFSFIFSIFEYNQGL